VPLEEPRWWYGAPPDDRRARLLAPLGHIYGWSVERRFRLAKPVRSRFPVVCVGNFTAGGTGKTPLAILIAEELARAGAAPVFLTRGYGGRAAGPVFVDPARDGVREVGDEPLLLARVAPTIVARDRRAGLALIERGERPADVVVMDDGLQNPHIAKDLTIAVVDGARGVGNGEIIPAGPLRAALEFQLGLVDAILVNGPASGPGPDVLRRLKRGFPGPVLAAEPRAAGDTSWLAGAAVAAYAGIGNPHRFFALLESLGARLAVARVFPDHHAFGERDADALLRAADAASAELVTTEKDLVRLLGATDRRGELAARSRALPIRLWLDERDMRRLGALLAGVRSSARPPTAEL
jgi:tetraacyldisaccharide 4'-kinase